MLEIRLLGKFEVKHNQKLIRIASRPAQSLFAYLVLNAGTSHRREKLAGMLWPDSLEETARENLRHALWRLRKSLPPNPRIDFLLTDDMSIAFNAAAECWLDAGMLENLKEDCSADELITALSEYRGELLPGFYDEWVVLQREHLYSIFEHHMARLLSLLENERRWLDILSWGERWIKFGQKPEPAYRALMSAHAAKGDMSKVAATYERCVQSLKEYGVPPSEQTRALYERLKAGKENFETNSVIPATQKRSEPPKTNLPNPITSFIGREKDVEAVVSLVGKNRLVTLMGPGGVGKTRLAIQSANKLFSKFRDGIWWVELAPLIDEAFLPQATAQALGVHEAPGQPLIESVKAYLQEKQLLLILDNCEHLINGCAQFSHDLLTQCAHLRILTTSREALDIMGEAEYQVQPLALPDPAHLTLVDLLLEYEGIRLFVERANAKSGFTLTEKNANVIVQLCQQLDGIPLALELAAARTRLMSVAEILERLNDRFNLLTLGNRTALPRHQTLRAAIDWSYELLSREEQILFRRLAVFAGGWTLEAAQAICSSDDIEMTRIPDLLSNLVDKSLAITQEQTGATRYQMLETIREYGREKLNELGEKERVHQRHLDFFVAFAEEAAPKLKGAGQVEWLDRLESEHDNLRAAWEFAIANDYKLALRLASALLNFWRMRGSLSEAHEWSTKLLVQTELSGQTLERAIALNMAGYIAFLYLDLTVARRLLEEALPLARTVGDQKEIAMALLTLGRIAYRQHDDLTTRQFLGESVTIYERLQDPWGTAMAAFHSVLSSDYAEAEKQTLQSLAIFQDLGDRFMVGNVLNTLGELARLQRQYERAGEYYEKSIKILRELHSRGSLASPSFNFAWVSLHRGDYRKAKALFAECFQVYQEYGNKVSMMECLAGFAAVAGMTGKPQQAARLFGAADALIDAVGVRDHIDLSDQKEFDYYVSVVREELDPATFAKAWADGCSMTMEQATAFALEETSQ